MISRPAEERLVLFSAKLSGAHINLFGWGFGPRYLDLAVASDLPFHKAHICGEVFN